MQLADEKYIGRETGHFRHAWRARRRAGMTMVEILVAIAIFLTVIVGVVTLFSGVVRTVRTGYQVKDAYAMGRAALAVIDRDLTTAFTSREAGEVEQFYGQSRGFMFVGYVGAASSGSEGGELHRVTYVVHPSVSTYQFDTEIAEPWGNVLGAVRAQAAAAGLDPGLVANALVLASAEKGDVVQDEVVKEFRVRVTTKAILRIEEKVPDLDSFELPQDGLQWPYVSPVFAKDDVINPGDPDTNSVASVALYNELRNSIGGIRETLVVRADQGNAPTGLGADVVEAILKAKRREIWLRLLSGETVGGLDYWAWRAEKGKGVVTDYVLADRILDRAEILFDVPTGIDIALNVLNVPGLFSFSNGTESLSTYNDAGGIPGYSAFMADGAIAAFDEAVTAFKQKGMEILGCPLDPRLPYVVGQQFWVMTEKPLPGQADIRKWFSQSVTLPAAMSRNAEAGN